MKTRKKSGKRYEKPIKMQTKKIQQPKKIITKKGCKKMRWKHCCSFSLSFPFREAQLCFSRKQICASRICFLWNHNFFSRASRRSKSVLLMDLNSILFLFEKDNMEANMCLDEKQISSSC